MSFARASSVLSSWMLALALGLGPPGADVLAALGHAQVCSCCQESEVTSCCGDEGEESESPQVVAEAGCPCAIIAPSEARPGALVPRASDAGCGVRARLERSHRAVELAWTELPPSAVDGESSPAPPRWPAPASPPGSSGARGSGRAAALGVLRL